MGSFAMSFMGSLLRFKASKRVVCGMGFSGASPWMWTRITVELFRCVLPWIDYCSYSAFYALLAVGCALGQFVRELLSGPSKNYRQIPRRQMKKNMLRHSSSTPLKAHGRIKVANTCTDHKQIPYHSMSRAT
jgi:hypothetical protein